MYLNELDRTVGAVYDRPSSSNQRMRAVTDRPYSGKSFWRIFSQYNRTTWKRMSAEIASPSV